MRLIGKATALVLGVGLATAFVASTRPHPPEIVHGAEPEAVEVEVEPASLESIAVELSCYGTVAARTRVTVAARISATVTEVSVREGQSVDAGTVLLTLDDQDLVAAAAEAEARRIVADRALEEARRERTRTEDLFERGARTAQQRDAAVTAEQAATATARAATEVETAARVRLSYARIVAPTDAVVARRHVEPGDLAVPGSPLLVLLGSDGLELRATVSPTAWEALALGDRVDLAFDGVEAGAVGRVVERAPEFDPATRQGSLVLALEDPSPAIAPGRVGRFTLPVDQREAWSVPAAAIVRRGQVETLFEVAGESTTPVARLRVVHTGRDLPGDRVEITGGIDRAIEVVTRGATDLRDGDRLQVVRDSK